MSPKVQLQVLPPPALLHQGGVGMEEEGAGQVSTSCFPPSSSRDQPPLPQAVCQGWRLRGG